MDGKIIVEYVWIGGKEELRSKSRVLSKKDIGFIDTNNLSQIRLPNWNYDGSSTCQAQGSDSEVIIIPQRIIRCPFRKGDNIIVMCDEYMPNGDPIPTNHRFLAKAIFDKKPEEHPWYGLEQEFFLVNNKTNKPLGFNGESYCDPTEQGQYYCSIGADNAFGREVLEDALANMLYAGLTVSGINAEVAPGQWEYQIGPVEGIDAADQLWLSRYILQRTAEKYNVRIDFEPKPLSGDWNGSGCHTNYSTKSMREEGGLKVIEDAIERLSKKHLEHIVVYGKNNEHRMTGKHETASYYKFTHGRANRGASVRIGNDVIAKGYGYFEDRRPSSNMNPYQVISKIFETTCL